MGTSYDGVYFYGLVYDNGEDGVPEVTQAVFDASNADDFDDWLDAHLGVAQWWADGGQTRPITEYNDERAAKCLAAFGVAAFEFGTLGHCDYSATYVAPEGSSSMEWRYGAVPSYDAETVERWRVACERLAEVLPGASAPGFYFGCSVG